MDQTNSINYEYKYLKYKNKYLILKQEELEGAGILRGVKKAVRSVSQYVGYYLFVTLDEKISERGKEKPEPIEQFIKTHNMDSLKISMNRTTSILFEVKLDKNNIRLSPMSENQETHTYTIATSEKVESLRDKIKANKSTTDEMKGEGEFKFYFINYKKKKVYIATSDEYFSNIKINLI